VPSSSALIPMPICSLQCLFSHSFTTHELLNRDYDVHIYIGIRADELGINRHCNGQIDIGIRADELGIKVPPFSLKYEWQFWSKFYHLQFFFLPPNIFF
jgi:hypothetical protein